MPARGAIGDAALGQSWESAPAGSSQYNRFGRAAGVVSGCVTVTEALLADQGLSPRDIDLFEIHEAFAATVVKTRQAWHRRFAS